MRLITCGFTLLTAVILAEAFNWTAYYDVDDMYAWLKSMAQKYPNNAKLIVAGNSYEGRQILGLKITGDKKTAKRSIMIESGIHAREWIAPATTTYFINQLLTSTNKTISGLKNAVDWHIFPTVNPDGYHYSHTTDRLWRKTRSPNAKQNSSCWGTDGNRNWNYHWNTEDTSTEPCDLTYGGTKAFSAPEVLNLSKYILGLGNNLLSYFAFHSDEQCVYVPYSDSKVHYGNYNNMVKAAKKFMAYAGRVNGTKYCGPATTEEISYGSSGMSIDWVYKNLGTNFTYIVELRGDNFQFPAKYIYVQGDEVTQMMLGIVDAVKEMGYL